MKYQIVLVERFSYYHAIEIEADTEQAAREKALERISEQELDPQELIINADYDLEVVDVEEAK